MPFNKKHLIEFTAMQHNTVQHNMIQFVQYNATQYNIFELAQYMEQCLILTLNLL